MKYLIIVTLFVLLGCNTTPKSPKVRQPVKVKEPKKPKPLPKTAILPRQLQKLQVNELKVGESGWINPVRFRVDAKNRCWVSKFATVFDYNENCLEIKQTSKGLVIVVSNSKKKWRGYNSDFDIADWLPVAEVVIK